MRVVIAGAGLGGLTAAIALARRQIDVVLCERAAAFAPIGAGIQLGPNATRVLRVLGLEEALRPLVSEAAGKEVRLWNTGEAWPLFDLGEDCRQRFGAPYWMVHRGDLHGVLVDELERLAPGALRLGAPALDVSQNAASATLHLAEGTVTGDVVIAADGVHSRLRDAFSAAPRARFTGLMAWRGLAATERLPAELRRPVGTNWVGPGAHVITYPVRGGALMNFVGVVENAEWTGESWSEAGARSDCAADFEGWHPLVQDIVAAIDIPYRWALVERDPVEAWVHGRCAMLGDACHATLPFLAQGAGMAIEDGIVLAACLARVAGAPAQDASGVTAALERYAALRKPRTDAVIAGSSGNTGRFHNPDLARPESARRYVAAQWAPDAVRRRYDWLFDYDATRVAEPA
ncbi:FAD-dependent monooxygenase [Roseivivax sp. CAU 1761]